MAYSYSRREIVIEGQTKSILRTAAEAMGWFALWGASAYLFGHHAFQLGDLHEQGLRNGNIERKVLLYTPLLCAGIGFIDEICRRKIPPGFKDTYRENVEIIGDMLWRGALKGAGTIATIEAGTYGLGRFVAAQSLQDIVQQNFLP